MEGKPPQIGNCLHESFGDVDDLLSIRNWLQYHLEGTGADIIGKGIGMGCADITIKMDGRVFHVSMKPYQSVAN